MSIINALHVGRDMLAGSGKGRNTPRNEKNVLVVQEFESRTKTEYQYLFNCHERMMALEC